MLPTQDEFMSHIRDRFPCIRFIETCTALVGSLILLAITCYIAITLFIFLMVPQMHCNLSCRVNCKVPNEMCYRECQMLCERIYRGV